MSNGTARTRTPSLLFTGAIWLGETWSARERRLAGAPPEPTSWLVIHARAVFLVVLATALIRSSLLEPYQIPSGSMMPSLVAGDFILVKGKSTPSMSVKVKQKSTGAGDKKHPEPYFDPDGELKKFTGGRINWYGRDPEWKDMVGFRGKDKEVKYPGIAVKGMSADQKKSLQAVLDSLIEPYRKEDQEEVQECLKKQGGLDACFLAFYKDGNLGDDGEWDNWRLEGPSFVWYFRGTPHVHIWINVADDPTVELNAKG